MTEDALAYAKEVWAACATLGFDSAGVRRLKAELDALAAAPDRDDVDRVLALATQVQRESIAWAVAQPPR